MKKKENYCLNCSDDPIEASKHGIQFCDEACRLEFDRKEDR